MKQTFLVPALALCALATASCARSQPAPTATNINWIPMPLVSPESLKMPGVTIGGEGGQWPRGAPQISPADPNFLLLPIDVGGIYRSVDGGKLWRQSTSGMNSRGANAFAMDPKNVNRVIGVGGNGGSWDPSWGQSPNGMYLSTNKAVSWKQTLAIPDGRAASVVIDATSYDAAKKYCTTAYYNAATRGLFRSDDGGASWIGLSRATAFASDDWENQSLLAMQPTKSVLYIANKNGFYRSLDKGKSFIKSASSTRLTGIKGLSVSNAQPNKVWISNLAGLSVSEDGGKTFKALPASGISRDADAAILEVTVSPADANKMLVWVQNANYRWLRYISSDGGQSFKPIAMQAGLQTRVDPGAVHNTNATIAGGPTFLPFNTRNGLFSWHPTDANIVMGIGGDWITKSTDGGQTFLWSNNGFNGVMIGSSFNFDATQPEKVFLGTQDNNGMFTTDGGKSWNYRDVSGKGWGGFLYGAGQSGTDAMWAGDADGWTSPRKLKVSRDSGKTWKVATDSSGKEITYGGRDVSYTDPKNTSRVFASNWRSVDKGATWKAMSDCEGVYTHAADGRLFGKKGDALVQSKDGGTTWTKVVDVEGGFGDVAFDSKREKWYFASQDVVKSWDKSGWKSLSIPKDQKGNTKCVTVAVDPLQTDVVYGGGPANIYKSSATVYRSRDAGTSWENLSRGDGPQEVQWIRVNPKTGDAWLNGQCFGMWRIARPTVLGAADPKLANSALQGAVKEGETPPPASSGGKLEISKIVRDFGPSGLEYTYGPHWKNGENIKGDGDVLRFDTDEAGGGGMVLNGVNLAPFGENYLVIRARALSGTGAQSISAKIISDGKEATQLSFDLSKLKTDKWMYLLAPMGAGDFSKVAQIQLQGTNFGGGSPLKIEIDKIGTTKLAAGAALFVEDGAAAKTTETKSDAKADTKSASGSAPASDNASISNVVRDLGNADYTFGPDWKNGENVKLVDSALRFDTTEAGGAGLVLNGADFAPQKQTHLAMRARALPGNEAKSLNVNLMRDDDLGGKITLTFDLTKLKTDSWTTLTMPLGAGKWNKVNQLQFQGTNWSPGAPKLKIEIDSIGTTSLDAKANKAAAEARASDPTNAPPAKALPKVAGWGFYPDYPQAWMNMHKGFLDRTKQGREKKDIDIVFLGDSITQGWGGSGGETWKKFYEPLKAVNYGIGGDSTRQVLWRIQKGEVDGLSPKLVVLKIGTNNLYGDHNAGSDDEIADGIKTIVSTLQTKLPKTKILLLGLLPRQNDFFSNRTKNINTMISKLDNGKTIRFLDMSSAFQTEIGKVKPELYNADQLHLEAPGYEMWAKTMAPLFNAMLK